MNALKHLAEKIHHHDKHAHDTKDTTLAHEHAVNSKNTPPSFVETSSSTVAPSLHKDVVVTPTTTAVVTPVAVPVVVEEKHSHSLFHRNKSEKKVTIAEPVRPNVITTETFDYETIVADPKVDEIVRTDVLLEVQPVVHKEIDQEVVHHIEKHIVEAPEKSRATEVTLAPKIIEHVHTHVIEEVQPIIHREVAVQKVEKVQEFKTEHVVAPAQHLNEVTHEVGTGRVDMHVHHNGNTHVAKPIIDEHIRTDVLVEVQPIVHKEIDRTVVNHIEKHITEAPAPSLAGKVQLAPVVQENVHVREVDEVQPIVHREKAVVKVDHVDQHITENVVAPTAHTHSLARETSNTKYTAGEIREEGKIINAPIIDERIRTDTLLEVQPVIHREIDQDVVHHIERHIDEAPAPSLAGRIELAPKIEEHVHTHVVNEVQPVVHREISQQKVERVEEHLTEKVVAPATHTHAVVEERAVDGHYHGEASTLNHRVHAPIIDEKLRTDVVVEVQPVVHKEIDQEVVNHIEKHITEAPAPSLAGKVQLAPKIEEKVHTHTINEIQPIVHKEKAVRVVEHQDAHVTERVVAPAVHTHEKVVESVKPVVVAEKKVFLPAGGAPVVATPLP